LQECFCGKEERQPFKQISYAQGVPVGEVQTWDTKLFKWLGGRIWWSSIDSNRLSRVVCKWYMDLE